MTAAWAYGEPSDNEVGKAEECLVLDKNKKHGLADDRCWSENAFVCEIRGNISIQ